LWVDPAVSAAVEPQKTVQLGSSAIRVPALGVGAWAWGDRVVWGYGRGYGRAEVRAAFHASLDAGLTFVDTAEIYGTGRSERLLGEFLGERTEGVIVATKFFPYPWRLRRGDLARALRASLRRLGLPRVALYQIHFPSPPIPVRTWAEALADVLSLGLTQTAGVSNFNRRQTREAHGVLLARGHSLTSNQIEFSLLERGPERTGLLGTCQDLGVTVIAYSPLAMGLLTGKFSPSRPPPVMRRRAFARVNLDRLLRLIEALREVGQAHGGKTPGQVALNWVIAKGALPIPGAKNADQARENAGALGWRMSPDEMRHLERVADQTLGL